MQLFRKSGITLGILNEEAHFIWGWEGFVHAVLRKPHIPPFLDSQPSQQFEGCCPGVAWVLQCCGGGRREKRKKEGRGERGGGGVGRGDGTSGGLIKPSWWFWVSNHTCDAQGNHKIGCKYKGVWQWWVRDAIDNFRKALENQRPWLAKKRWLNKMWHTLMTK